MELLAELHPRIIHFPIAFLFIYPVIELSAYIWKSDFFKKAAMLLLILGVVSSIGAVLSGNQAFQLLDSISKQAKYLFEQHEYYANLSMWLFTFILIVRFFAEKKKKYFKKVQFVLIILGLIGMICIYQTGNYGAKLAKEVSTKIKVVDKSYN